MSWIDVAKKRAAKEAAKHVKDGLIIGLGTGTTAAFVIKEIGRRIREEGLKILGIPTSIKSSKLAIENDIPLTTLMEHPIIDLDIDGADQIDSNLDLIKGWGGALTLEKIVALSSKEVIIVADERKITDKLGQDKLLPIEIVPCSLSLVSTRIQSIGGKLELRIKDETCSPYITQNGNFIIDVDFGIIKNPSNLEMEIKKISGVVESGLFVDITEIAYVGTKNEVHKFIHKRSKQ